jgi:hypothetical protein
MGCTLCAVAERRLLGREDQTRHRPAAWSRLSRRTPSVPPRCQVLKQRKLYESQREQLYQQQFNMEQTRFTVDSIKDTVTSVQVRSVTAMGAVCTPCHATEVDRGFGPTRCVCACVLCEQALKAASKEMKTAFKKNKELDIGYIENMQDDMMDMMVSKPMWLSSRLDEHLVRALVCLGREWLRVLACAQLRARVSAAVS